MLNCSVILRMKSLTPWQAFLGRLLMGLGFGLASVATPSYLSEVVVPVRDHGAGMAKVGESHHWHHWDHWHHWHHWQVTLSPESPKDSTKVQSISNWY